ncbi:TPA: hypothetical protein RXC39_004996 [Escherichia coli]|nr:hypothetical protein [Escherichia coli]
MNKEQLIDKLERVVCGQYSYEMQELAYSALCCIKGTPDDCAKFPVTRPLPDTLVDVWDEIGQYLGTGKAIETRSCGVSLLLHGHCYDSNHVLYWRNAGALPAACDTPLAGGSRKLFTCSACGVDGLDEPPETSCHCCTEGAHWVESRLFTYGQADPEEFRPVAVVKECAGSTPDDRLIWSVIEQLNGELAEGDKLFKRR